MEEKARRHFESIEQELMHAVELGASDRVAYQCGRLDAQRDERWWFIRFFAFVLSPGVSSWMALAGMDREQWMARANKAKSRALIRVVSDRHSELWDSKSTPARVELARILIESGADPLGEHDGDSLVVAAARRACPSMVALLIAHGADPEKKSLGGHSARDYLGMMRLRYEERGLSEQLDRALWARSRRVSEIESKELSVDWPFGSSELMVEPKRIQSRAKRL